MASKLLTKTLLNKRSPLDSYERLKCRSKKKQKGEKKLSTQRILKKEAQQQREREAQGRDFPKLWLFCVDKVS